MLLRFTLSAAGAMVLAGSAFAQNATQAQPITSAVKDAGTYHLATGTWTRGVGATALAGPEVIYDNTCTTGFYIGLPQGEESLDSGRVPSTSSPNNPVSLTGLYDSYVVNGFQIGYCTFEPLTTDLGYSFFDCYAACDNGGAGYPTPTVAFNITGLPGGTATGGQGCWLVTLDLMNTTFTFGLGGDCNGTYDNVASTDSFGWSWTQTIPTTGLDAGPLLTGDPLGLINASCGGVGGGTTFPGATAGPGSGIGNLDQFESLTLGGTGGCFFFGGYSAANPYSGFYLQLSGDAGGPTNNTGVAYCFGDGSGALCPCVNNGGTGEGCANSAGNGATLAGSGNASFSNDTLTLTVAGVNGNKPGLLLRGNNQVAVPAGDGILCTAGGSQRSQVQVTVNGGTVYTTFNGGTLGSVANVGAPTNYQYWYRDPNPLGPCGTAFNFTNGWTVTYQP